MFGRRMGSFHVGHCHVVYPSIEHPLAQQYKWKIDVELGDILLPQCEWRVEHSVKPRPVTAIQDV